jgi:hypothetical protein
LGILEQLAIATAEAHGRFSPYAVLLYFGDCLIDVHVIFLHAARCSPRPLSGLLLFLLE